MTNLAEAGFLADDLASGEIEARIYQSEDFSAARGAWSTSYLIQVPADHAQEAVTRIRRHLVEEEVHSDSRSDRYNLDSYEAPFDASAWRPLALVVLAGVASFVIGQRFAAPEGPRRPPPRDSLSTAVETIGRPFLTEPVPGKPRYRLSYDWRREAWYLDGDFNGDGRFEQRRQFPNSGASR